MSSNVLERFKNHMYIIYSIQCDVVCACTVDIFGICIFIYVYMYISWLIKINILYIYIWLRGPPTLQHGNMYKHDILYMYIYMFVWGWAREPISRSFFWS